MKRYKYVSKKNIKAKEQLDALMLAGKKRWAKVNNKDRKERANESKSA